MGKPLGMLALAAVLSCADGSGPLMETDTMELTSTFDNEQPIPTAFTCDGEGVSPPLSISRVPEETRTLVLIVDDPDAPSGTFDHWIAFDFAPTDRIPEGVGQLGISGTNSSGGLGYTPPCPPSGTHRYFFRLLALDTQLGLPEGATSQEVLEAAEGHILGRGSLMGTYRR